MRPSPPNLLCILYLQDWGAFLTDFLCAFKTSQFLFFYFLSPILLFMSPEITALQSPPPPLLASSAQLCTRGIGELFLTDFLCAFCTGKLTFAMCTIPTTTCQSIHIISSSIIEGNDNQMTSFGKRGFLTYFSGRSKTQRSHLLMG